MRYVSAFFFSIFLALFGSHSIAERASQGELEYERSCIQCHGPTGKGDGYLASSLAIAPPDLTAIMSRNDGTFPVSDIYQLIISGTWDGRIHIAGEMPVWGPRYALEASDKFVGYSENGRTLVEYEVHQLVAALVNHIYQLQLPAPANIEAAFAIVQSQFVEIFSVKPDALELVAIAPSGYQASWAEAVVEWERHGKRHLAGGAYEMEGLAIRDLVGGQRQTSFVFSAKDRPNLAEILGNSDLIVKLIELRESGADQNAPHNRLKLDFNIGFCLDDQKVAKPFGFPEFHVRDRQNGLKLFSINIPTGVEEFSSGPCN